MTSNLVRVIVFLGVFFCVDILLGQAVDCVDYSANENWEIVKGKVLESSDSGFFVKSPEGKENFIRLTPGIKTPVSLEFKMKSYSNELPSIYFDGSKELGLIPFSGKYTFGNPDEIKTPKIKFFVSGVGEPFVSGFVTNHFRIDFYPTHLRFFLNGLFCGGVKLEGVENINLSLESEGVYSIRDIKARKIKGQSTPNHWLNGNVPVEDRYIMRVGSKREDVWPGPADSYLIGVFFGEPEIGSAREVSVNPIYASNGHAFVGDFVNVEYFRQQLMEDMIEDKPVSSYDPPDSMVIAKPGYAVGGVNVNVGKNSGLQLIFMKKTPKGLDPNDCYTSRWMGQGTGKPRTLKVRKGCISQLYQGFPPDISQAALVVLPGRGGFMQDVTEPYKQIKQAEDFSFGRFKNISERYYLGYLSSLLSSQSGIDDPSVRKVIKAIYKIDPESAIDLTLWAYLDSQAGYNWDVLSFFDEFDSDELKKHLAYNADEKALHQSLFSIGSMAIYAYLFDNKYDSQLSVVIDKNGGLQKQLALFAMEHCRNKNNRLFDIKPLLKGDDWVNRSVIDSEIDNPKVVNQLIEATFSEDFEVVRNAVDKLCQIENPDGRVQTAIAVNSFNHERLESIGKPDFDLLKRYYLNKDVSYVLLTMAKLAPEETYPIALELLKKNDELTLPDAIKAMGFCKNPEAIKLLRKFEDFTSLASYGTIPNLAAIANMRLGDKDIIGRIKQAQKELGERFYLDDGIVKEIIISNDQAGIKMLEDFLRDREYDARECLLVSMFENRYYNEKLFVGLLSENKRYLSYKAYECLKEKGYKPVTRLDKIRFYSVAPDELAKAVELITAEELHLVLPNMQKEDVTLLLKHPQKDAIRDKLIDIYLSVQFQENVYPTTILLMLDKMDHVKIASRAKLSLSSKNKDTRRAALDMIALFDKDVLKTLKPFYDDTDFEIRLCALWYCAGLGDKDALNKLQQLAKSEDKKTQFSARWLLANIKPPRELILR